VARFEGNWRGGQEEPALKPDQVSRGRLSHRRRCVSIAAADADAVTWLLPPLWRLREEGINHVLWHRIAGILAEPALKPDQVSRGRLRAEGVLIRILLLRLTLPWRHRHPIGRRVATAGRRH
jgi:hypothetical protein